LREPYFAELMNYFVFSEMFLVKDDDLQSALEILDRDLGVTARHDSSSDSIEARNCLIDWISTLGTSKSILKCFFDL
jgi:hypothetical protein